MLEKIQKAREKASEEEGSHSPPTYGYLWDTPYLLS